MVTTILLYSFINFYSDYSNVNIMYDFNKREKNITFFKKSKKKKKINFEIDNNLDVFNWCLKYKHNKVSNNELYKIIEYAYKYSDNPELTLAVISVESNFNKNAKSKVKAAGLMQVMPFWKKTEAFKELGITNLHSIHENIVAGNYILNLYIKKTGSLSKALNKYVNGSSKYVSKVLTRYNNLKSIKLNKYYAKN